MEVRLPLTERILARLPGPRAVWVLAWIAIPLAAIPLPNAYIAAAGQNELSARIVAGVVFAYVAALSLWAARRFTQHMAEAETSLRESDDDPGPIFRGVDSNLGPLGIAALFTAVTTVRTAGMAGMDTALIWFPISAIANIAAGTGIWAYLVILIGLDRVGRRKISLDLFPEDLSLGLSEVGHVAFGAFGAYVAGFVPALIPFIDDPYRLALSVLFFVLGIVVFFASLERLHRQLVRARKTQIEWARDLYSRAFDPLRDGSLETLERQAHVLQAAEALEARAETIQRWPFPDRRLRQIQAIAGTVITFATTGVVTRLILAGFGL